MALLTREEIVEAWRDDVDISDVRQLLQEIASQGNRDQIWKRVVPYLVPGDQLKAQYAFQDLWDTLYGNA